MFKFQKSFTEKFVSIIDLVYKSVGITKHDKTQGEYVRFLKKYIISTLGWIRRSLEQNLLGKIKILV